jgi:hypothetical protein
VRSDIGSPVMRKSNIFHLRGRKDKAKGKGAKSQFGRQRTCIVSKVGDLKKPDSPSATSGDGHSRKVSPGKKRRQSIAPQHHKTNDMNALR